MADLEFMGLLVTTLITLIGGLAVIIKPLISLNTNITKLNSSIEKLVADGQTRDKRLNLHETRLDGLERDVTRHDVEINNLKRS